MNEPRKPTLDRRHVVAAILKNRGDALVVAGLGAPCFDVMSCGNSPLNFYTWGGMGSAALHLRNGSGDAPGHVALLFNSVGNIGGGLIKPRHQRID